MSANSSENHPVPKGLLAVLFAMSKKQRDLFKQYLNFEPFESNSKLAVLYQLIELYYLSKKQPNIGWDKALSNAKIKASHLSKLQSYLHQRLDQFLAMQQILQFPHRYQSYTIEAYNSLKLDYSNIEKRSRQLLKKIQKDAHSIDHFQQMNRLEQFALQARIASKKKLNGSYFEDIHTLIDQNFLLGKLKYVCASVNEAAILNQPFPQKSIDALKALLEMHVVELPPFGQAYLQLLLLMENAGQNIEVYQATFESLIKYQPKIASFDNLDLFNYLLNLSYRRVALGIKGFIRFIAQIYAHLIQSKLLLLEEEIPVLTFKNIVSVNCRLENYEWSLRFIQDYQKYLAPDARKILPTFCIGLVNFYSGNFSQSAAYFRTVIQNDSEGHFLGFESRNLLLKSYFHRLEDLSSDEYEDLYKLINSFRMNVRRNTKLSKFHQKSYLNFIHYFNTMLRHREQHGNKTAYPIALQTEIEDLEFITNKSWLLKEIQEKMKR